MSETRPPVVAIMGHIDHGKSTLLDYIRESNITEKEAGGITQHISAYEVTHEKEGKRSKITFLDTPGHEAFQGVRTRGASAADIAVLVVSGEDGVKPQTLEALKYIKEASTPYIVAITKMDKSSADAERTKQSLAENEIFVEGYGGDVPMVAVSAKTGDGVDELLDLILLASELEELKGDSETTGRGVIIESRLDPKVGITAVGVIKDGTVRKGMFAATRGAIAPLRFIKDALGNMEEELTFSSPIEITGWTEEPQVGQEFRTFLKKEEATEYAEAEKAKTSEAPDLSTAEGEEILPIVLKADASGSLEAIIGELEKLKRERISARVVLSGIGAITEKDVRTATVSPNSIVIGFNSKVDSQAKALAERNNIPLLNFDIIYELTDKVKELLEEREPRIEVEEVKGRAKILKCFSAIKDKQVVGGRVEEGSIEKGLEVKILRRDTEIGRGKVKELQQSKVATDAVSEGTEFGTMIESRTEIAPGDIVECLVKVTK